jgi:hypothetical protein
MLVAVVILALTNATAARAQSRADRATVLENAPITLLPDASRVPLRVAAKGTSLVILTDEGDWIQVQFQDPQFGPRVGYIQKRFVRIQSAALQPLDLSVPTERNQSGVASTSAPPSVGSPQVAPPVLQRPPLVRRGFWFNAGLGYGALSCDTCGGDYAGGASGGLAAGGTITERFLLGAGTTGWYRSQDNVWISASTFDVRMRFYPVRTSGFFINGGLGVGEVRLGTGRLAVSETGVGTMIGVGWDIRTGNNISITPFWNGSGIATDSVTVGFGQIGLGLTVH